MAEGRICWNAAFTEADGGEIGRGPCSCSCSSPSLSAFPHHAGCILQHCAIAARARHRGRVSHPTWKAAMLYTQIVGGLLCSTLILLLYSLTSCSASLLGDILFFFFFALLPSNTTQSRNASSAYLHLYLPQNRSTPVTSIITLQPSSSIEMASSSCSHLSHPGAIQTPPSSLTRPEECSQCFDNQDSQDGVDICLGCYNAGCPRLHAQAHADKFGDAHALVVNIRRVRKQLQQSDTAAKRVGHPF